MQIGAINSINFKANPAACPVCEDETGIFANGDFKGEEVIDTIDKFQKTIVDSEDIKGPAAIVTAVSCAGAKTFLKGAGAALALDRLTSDNISTHFENLLRRFDGIIKNASKSLSNFEGKAGVKKLATLVSNGMNHAEVFAKNAYKKISGSKSTRGLAITAGIASAVTGLIQILGKDGDGDGIKDIMQKSQNVYAANSAKIDRVQEGAGLLAEAFQLLT